MILLNDVSLNKLMGQHNGRKVVLVQKFNRTTICLDESAAIDDVIKEDQIAYELKKREIYVRKPKKINDLIAEDLIRKKLDILRFEYYSDGIFYGDGEHKKLIYIAYFRRETK